TGDIDVSIRLLSCCTFFLLLCFFFFFFFFQAEDGIRDRTVTGVQTCALPILLGVAGRLGQRRQAAPADEPVAALLAKARPAEPRSEERRVGKECRSRWWPDH